MKQNNHYIWYIPLYFMLFFSCYTLLKFIVIFFFMTAYIPSFLFDFSFLYMFSGFDNTQLLFIGMILIITNLYLHLALSKRHLLFSFPLTLLLLSGIGLRVATSAVSLNYIFHYIIFSMLLLVLVIDHKLYLFIPENYQTPLDKTKSKVERVSLPAFNTIHPTPNSAQGFSSISKTILKSLDDVKKTISSRLGVGSPRPTTAGAGLDGVESSIGSDVIGQSNEDVDSFIHLVERDLDKIVTTKQMLKGIGVQSLDYLDSKINETKLEDTSFLDSFFKELSLQKGFTPIDDYDFSSIVNQIEESAIILARGVVKAANTQFASLIHQPIGDIIDQDFINFLAPEGYANFKSHCSKRLSGESSQNFNVVLYTRNHEKIPLQAIIKTTNINGEPIEITIFQTMNT